jgi:hypothetical protein
MDDLVVFIILDFNDSLFDEVHFFDVGLIVDNDLAWGNNSAE